MASSLFWRRKTRKELNHRFSPWQEDVVATNAADNSGRENTRSTLSIASSGHKSWKIERLEQGRSLAHFFDCMRKIFLRSSAYRKITKISPGALYFSKALFKGLIFWRGLYSEGSLRFKNRVRLAYSWKEIYRFFFVFEGTVFKYKPLRGLYYSEGPFKGGFFELRVWGAYTWRGLFSEFYGD